MADHTVTVPVVSVLLSAAAIVSTVAIAPSVATDATTRVILADGAMVPTGFIDLNTHFYTGVCPIATGADATSNRAGATTMVSAGDAGAWTFERLRDVVDDRTRIRIPALVHISRLRLAICLRKKPSTPGIATPVS